MAHGMFNSPVNIATSPLDIPIFFNIMTDMVLTMKYGIPSAKYNVGTHAHALRVLPFILLWMLLHRDNNVPESPCSHGLPLAITAAPTWHRPHTVSPILHP